MGDLPAAARLEVFDHEGDGDLDIVVAGLGRLLPTDELTGYVTLLLQEGHQVFRSVPLVVGSPRVADVRPADLDGDGDLDFVVGMFGYIRTGAIGWLEQLGSEQFKLHVLFSFPGTVNVAVTDLNGDGRDDFLALVSQAQEQVVAFVNEGSGRFAPTVVFDARNPLFGASGMVLADLDRDGDQDVVLTNGDVFDARPELRPYSGIQWLESRGALQFVAHDLGRLYGAFGPAVGDLDGDGDMDVVGVSFFNDWKDRRRQSIVWLENDGRQVFTMRPLCNTPTDLVTCDLGDLNGDGRLDVVAGGLKAGRAEYLYGPPARRARLGIWTNLGMED
jgi:hypothetical protein